MSGRTEDSGEVAGASPANGGSPPGPLTGARLAAAIDACRAAGRTLEVPLSGSSMIPTLMPGDGLVIDARASRFPLGSILAFLEQDLLVAHRVVGRGQAGCLTKGDALLYFDRVAATPAAIVGLVVAVRRDGRRIDLLGARPRLLGMVVAAASRLVGEINRLLRQVRPAAGRPRPASGSGPSVWLARWQRLALSAAAWCLGSRRPPGKS